MEYKCKYAKKAVRNSVKYLMCGVDGGFCAFQRYCSSKRDVINTEGCLTCVAYTRQIKKEGKADG